MAHKISSVNILNTVHACTSQNASKKIIANYGQMLTKMNRRGMMITNIDIAAEPCITFNDTFFKWISDTKTPKEAVNKLYMYKGTAYERQYATPNVCASYLRSAPTSHFTNKQRSKYLSQCDIDILYAYFKPFYFTNMSLEQALRFTFTQLKLKILYNTIAMNVLLEALSLSYLIGNGKDHSETDILDLVCTFEVIVMLENGIHSVKKQKFMTKEEFMMFDQDTLLSECEMEQIYHNIAAVS
eukprot:UN08266